MVAQQSKEELEALLALLPGSIRAGIERHDRAADLVEVILDLGRVPTARLSEGEVILRADEVTREEIDLIVSGIGEFDDDNRAGIARTLHRIAGIRNRRGEVVGLTCRVGRAVYGTLDIISVILSEGNLVLLLGRPGVA